MRALAPAVWCASEAWLWTGCIGHVGRVCVCVGGVDLACGPADMTFVAPFGVCGNGDPMLPVPHTVGFEFGREGSVPLVCVSALC